MRSPETRAAVIAVTLAFALVLAACLPFALTGADVPAAVILLGRLLPGAASLTAIFLVLGRGQLARLWRTSPASPRELAASYGLALAVMLPVLALPAGAGILLGAELQPVGVLAAAVPTIVLGTVLFALSTVGEEVLWRGQLQTAVRRFGFWRSSFLVGMVWSLWHLPLYLTYLGQGTLTVAETVASTVSVAAWAPLLTALVERRGTLWPAVFAHAIPVSSLQLLGEGATGSPLTFWVVTGLGWAATLTAAAFVHAGTTPPLRGHPARVDASTTAG